MIWNIVILLVFCLTSVAFIRYKKSPGDGKLLAMGSAGLLVLVVIISFLMPGSFETPPPSGWNLALGEIISRQTSQLVPNGGKVLLFIAPKQKTDADQRTRKRQMELLQGFDKGLAKNFIKTIIETKTITGPSFPDGMLTYDDVVDGLRANPDAKAIVNFQIVETSLFTESSRRNQSTGRILPADLPLPKLILVGLTRKQAEVAIRAGQVQVAVVLREEANQEPTEEPRGNDARQIFDQRFTLLTADSFGK